jgi:hypothetical protein
MYTGIQRIVKGFLYLNNICFVFGATKGMTLEINALRYLKRVGYKVYSMV